MKYQKSAFYWYTCNACREMQNRKLKFQRKYFDEIQDFCLTNQGNAQFNYPEHNDRYLRQCYYNLEEKADRGIISPEEWQKIYDYCKEENLI